MVYSQPQHRSPSPWAGSTDPCLRGLGVIVREAPRRQNCDTTARTGRSNQVASLWAAMPKSPKKHAKSGFRAELKSSKTENVGYQNLFLKPESDLAWLETPWAEFLRPTGPRGAPQVVFPSVFPCVCFGPTFGGESVRTPSNGTPQLPPQHTNQTMPRPQFPAICFG